MVDGEKRGMTIARSGNVAFPVMRAGTAMGTPAGDRRYIRSNPPRLLLKLVRLGINCRSARTDALIGLRERCAAISAE